MCTRPCIYRESTLRPGGNAAQLACNYSKTGRTRTSTIAEMFNVAPGSKEHKQLMKAENCPLFEAREGMKILVDPYEITKKKRVRPYVPPADETLLFSLYEMGMSDLMIAVRTGSTDNKIRHWRKKRGLKAHKQH